MADTDTQTKTDSDLKQQARAAFGSTVSDANLIPIDEVKRLGVYTPEERPQLAALFEQLTKLIDSQYRLVERQKIIVKLLRQGVVELTTEDKRQFGNVPENERRSTLFFADLIQLASDIGLWLRKNEQSESLRELDSDPMYWLKELGEEYESGYISNIFPKDKVEKLNREVLASIQNAFKVGETEEGEEAQTTTSEITGAKMPDTDTLEAAVAAHKAGTSSQSDAGETSETTTPVEQAPQEELGIRERQQEQVLLLDTLRQELFENIIGEFTTNEIEQMWSDFQPGLIAEITDFFATHPELRAQLAAAEAGDGLVHDKVYQAFLLVLRANPSLTSRLVQMYTAASDQAVRINPANATAIEEKLTQVSEVVGTAAVAQISAHVEQAATIAQIPDTQPTPSTAQTPSTSQQTLTASESELQKNAAEYLIEHAEYEIFRKTRIFLHKLSPELDLSAQNIRLLLQEFARREALGLTTTQLQLAQNRPYLSSLYQRFALDLQAQYPEITSFLIDYGRYIQQADAAEAAQFETVFRNGILGKSVAAKDALATDLKSSLGGAATPIVVANTAATIDAMILEFGDKAPEFVEKISTDRLELAFGLAAGTLTADTAPIFVATLKSQLGLKLSVLNLTVGGGFLQSGGLQGGAASSDPDSIQLALSAIPQSRQMLTSHGAETTIAALGTPAAPIEKNHESWWSSLPKDVQLQLYDQVEGAGSSSQFVGFSSLPIPPKLGSYSNPEIRKLLVGIWTVSPQLSQQQTENLKQVNLLLDAQDRLAIQQVKVAKLREEVLAAVIQDIKDEQAAIIAAQMGLAVAEGESNQVAIQNAMISGAAPLAVTQLAGMSAALSGNSDAMVGTNPYTHDYGQGSAGIKSQIAAQLRRAFADKVKKKLAGSLLKGAATKAGLAATGVGLPVAAGLAILQNKTAREIALGGGAMLIGNTLYHLTTVGGALGAIGGGLIGGPIGAVIGANTVGALTANVPLLGSQWTSALGWSPNAPVSPFAASNPLGSSTTAGQSMSTLRGTTDAATSQGGAAAEAATPGSTAQPLSYSQQSALTGSPGAQAASSAATSSSLTGFLGATAAAVTATAAPLLGIGIGLFLSLQVLFIIYGAFLIKVPSEGVLDQTEELSKYATLTKEATPNAFENNTPTDVTYDIALAPKAEYQIQVTQVKDTYSYHGCGKDDCSLGLTSPLSLDSFPDSILSTTADTSYTTTISAEDTMIINSLNITFDVFDSTGNKLVAGENITSLAMVLVGDPEVGCFVFDSGVRDFGVGGFSIPWDESDIVKITTAYSELAANPKLTALVCAKGPITLSKLGVSKYNYYGWATSSDSIAFYSPTFAGEPDYIQYTLVHELGHIIDNRNAGLRATFVSTLPSNLHKCFAYPVDGGCSDIEAFAEAIARYVFSNGPYNIRTENPKEHAWLKNNVFGGIEY